MIKRLKATFLTDGHFSEILNGASSAFVIRILAFGVGYIFTLIVTKGYGAKAMGLFVLSLTVLQVLSVVGRLGLDTVLLRFSAVYSSKHEWATLKHIYFSSIKVVLLLTFLLSVGLYIGSDVIAEFVFSKPDLATYLQIISIGLVPTVILFVNTECFRGLKQIKTFMFWQQTSGYLFGSIFLVILYYYSNSRFDPVIAYLTAIIISALYVVISWTRVMHRSPFSQTDTSIDTKHLLSLSLPMLLANSTGLLLSWTDTIMLGILSSEREVGIYNVALKIAMGTSIVLVAVNSIAAPKFAELWGKHDLEGFKKVVRQSTRMISLASIPFLIIVMIFPENIMGIFGEEFVVGSTALLILSFGQFVNSISGSVGNVLKMTGHQSAFQKIMLFALILNIALNYILIKLFGINGAATSTAISLIVWNLASVVYIKYKFNFSTMWFPIIRQRS